MIDEIILKDGFMMYMNENGEVTKQINLLEIGETIELKRHVLDFLLNTLTEISNDSDINEVKAKSEKALTYYRNSFL